MIWNQQLQGISIQSCYTQLSHDSRLDVRSMIRTFNTMWGLLHSLASMHCPASVLEVVDKSKGKTHLRFRGVLGKVLRKITSAPD